MLWLPIVTEGSGCDLLKVWRDHADEVRGNGIDSGHFIAEERPDPGYGALKELFSA
jgi:haloacetate dehalogenase